MPYVVLAAIWFLVSDLLPGPAVLVAFLVLAAGVTQGFVRYRSHPMAELPKSLYVGVALCVGSAALLALAAIG